MDKQFNQLYEEYKRMVQSLVAEFVEDEHLRQDLEQEAWLKISMGLEKYKEEKSKTSTWIWTVTKNTCLNYLRDNVDRAPNLVMESDMPYDAFAEDEAADAAWLASHAIEQVTPQHYAEAEDAMQYYESLPKQQKEIVDRLSDGQNYAQIAEALGISQSTVRTHVERVKRALGY